MIVLICGFSRAGKTTYSKRYDGVCKVVHLDDTHSYENVLNIVRRCDGDIVVEGIYYIPKQRRELLKAYKGVGAKCVFLNTPLKVREQRLGRRLKHDYPFLVPTYEEGWDEIIVIGENE